MNKAKMITVRIQNDNKTTTTTILVGKKTNSRKINQKLVNPLRGTHLYIKRMTVDKTHSTRPVKFT